MAGEFDSAIVDPYGRINALAVFPEGGGATLVADVLLGSGKGTLNTRLGDWVGWIGIGGIVLFTFAGPFLVKSVETQDRPDESILEDQQG